MSPGEIVLVKFPFTDLDSTKKRPALILLETAITPRIKLVTLAMITSQIDGLKIPGDVLLTQWKEAKLLHPSLVRLSKVATLEQDLIHKSLGHLSKKDVSSVRHSLLDLYRFWLK